MTWSQPDIPELPEVETIVRELRKKIIGLKIIDFWSDKEKPVHQAGGVTKFKKEIQGKKVLSVVRRAKFIVIDIDGDKTMFIHQKISGHLMYGKWEQKNGQWVSKFSGPLKEDRQNQYIRYIWIFNNSYQLAMSDVRRFSRIILVRDKDVSGLKEIRDLGPEPLELNAESFGRLFRAKKGKIKPVLMDPTFIVGIGNIYADEILWDAGVHPLSQIDKLSKDDINRIFKSTRKILRLAIRYKGDSMDDYRLPSGEKGGYQNIQKAYQQTGKKCARKDGGVITRIKIGQRSAHFCPKHQRIA
ncbi:MAG: DNA-formamidopyrimidine glycosylase [Candidatus Yanofskybacteria bacterium]|nr:DNA-formamidopyrimidine glycosylase [Candidatus Yanofskybacteria bacterium]